MWKDEFRNIKDRHVADQNGVPNYYKRRDIHWLIKQVEMFREHTGDIPPVEEASDDG